MRISFVQIKVAHTVIFWVFSLCVAYTVYCGIVGRLTALTWIAAGLLLVEGVVLAACGWTCPLTILAERQGAARGSVADIFLPKPLADRIFPVCGTLYFIGLVLILVRFLGR